MKFSHKTNSRQKEGWFLQQAAAQLPASAPYFATAVAGSQHLASDSWRVAEDVTVLVRITFLSLDIAIGSFILKTYFIHTRGLIHHDSRLSSATCLSNRCFC